MARWLTPPNIATAYQCCVCVCVEHFLSEHFSRFQSSFGLIAIFSLIWMEFHTLKLSIFVFTLPSHPKTRMLQWRTRIPGTFPSKEWKAEKRYYIYLNDDNNNKTDPTNQRKTHVGQRRKEREKTHRPSETFSSSFFFCSCLKYNYCWKIDLVFKHCTVGSLVESQIIDRGNFCGGNRTVEWCVHDGREMDWMGYQRWWVEWLWWKS